MKAQIDAKSEQATRVESWKKGKQQCHDNEVHSERIDSSSSKGSKKHTSTRTTKARGIHLQTVPLCVQNIPLATISSTVCSSSGRNRPPRRTAYQR
jgi:hypothetical protein